MKLIFQSSMGFHPSHVLGRSPMSSAHHPQGRAHLQRAAHRHCERPSAPQKTRPLRPGPVRLSKKDPTQQNNWFNWFTKLKFFFSDPSPLLNWSQMYIIANVNCNVYNLHNWEPLGAEECLSMFIYVNLLPGSTGRRCQGARGHRDSPDSNEPHGRGNTRTAGYEPHALPRAPAQAVGRWSRPAVQPIARWLRGSNAWQAHG